MITLRVRAGLAKKRFPTRPAFSQLFGNVMAPNLAAASSVAEPAARLSTLEYLDSYLISSRKLR